MSPFFNSVVGIGFLVVGIAATFLMYHLWGYPFDKQKFKSAAPPRLMLVHRCLGYLYVAIYVYFLTQMVPRLWHYQIEFPARTVAHLSFGMLIGAILVVKIVIVRFFKHLESELIPLLGTALLICTVLLIGLSVPFALRELQLRRMTAGGAIFGSQSVARVRTLLPLAGIVDEAAIQRLASADGLRSGRDVLMNKCIYCHDLRTVLAKPRTPKNWRQTIQRMADRSTIFNPISESEQWQSTAYLIAISPELQRGVRQRREQARQADKSRRAVEAVAHATEPLSRPASGPENAYDTAAAKQFFEVQCTQCHSLPNFEQSPVDSAEDVRKLVARMVDNGLETSDAGLAQIVRYITETYVR